MPLQSCDTHRIHTCVIRVTSIRRTFMNAGHLRQCTKICSLNLKKGVILKTSLSHVDFQINTNRLLLWDKKNIFFGSKIKKWLSFGKIKVLQWDATNGGLVSSPLLLNYRTLAIIYYNLIMSFYSNQRKILFQIN